MSGYLVRVSCRDCCGEDFDGCFGGTHELWGDGCAEGGLFPDETLTPFASIGAAVDSAEERIDGAPWDFVVIDAETRAVVNHSSAAAANGSSSSAD